jgi:glucose/arabinose dehydrogenase
MSLVRPRPALLALVASLLVAAPAAAQGPPLPTAANGNAVTVAATGVPTPTAFAFDGAGTVFAGSGPSEDGKAPGGLFVVNPAGGPATLVPNTPPVVFGLAYHDGELYLSSGDTITAYRGWNGTSFAGSRVVHQGGRKFSGFGGLAFAPNGRLFVGLALDQKYDHAKDPRKYSQAVASMLSTGKGLRIVARGLRQPWQMTFVNGGSNPYVTMLAQDETKKIPPDYIAVAKQGQNYGFPKCTWLKRKTCKGFAKPLVFLPAHSSPMGISSIGSTLYVALFAGLTAKAAQVVTIPAGGGKPTPFLTGFVAPIVALGIDQGNVYVGELTGQIYKVAA